MRNGLIVAPNGNKYWYLNDSYHRENGPAIERTNESKQWWVNGQLHRLDGPAIEYSTFKAWYLHGEIVNCKTNEEFLRIVKLKAFW